MPACSAGAITRSTSSARAAANSAASAQGETWFESSKSDLICSPSSVPPGSRTRTTSRPSPRNASVSSSACVVFPEPSSPSNVTNTPAVRYGAVRVVVTGGAGFIGSHVAEALLARGDEVHVLDNLSSGRREKVPDGAHFHEGDIRSDAGAVFRDVRPEVCFHLAAQA